jgi:choline dehydrogenase
MMTCFSFTRTGARGNGFNKGGSGPSDAIAYPNLYQVFGSQATSAVQTILSSLPTWASSQAANALSAAALEQIYQVQAGLIINSSGKKAVLFLFLFLH